MSDKVSATIAALLHAYMDGDIQCLRFEFISSRGSLCGMITDTALGKDYDQYNNIGLITPELVEELKDTISILSNPREETVH